MQHHVKLIAVLEFLYLVKAYVNNGPEKSRTDIKLFTQSKTKRTKIYEMNRGHRSRTTRKKDELRQGWCQP